MKSRNIQSPLIQTLWVAALAVGTFLLLRRADGAGGGGYLALGIVTVMWVIFVVQLLTGRRDQPQAGAAKRANRWLVSVLLALVLAALLGLLFNCLRHRQLIGAGVSLLFVWVLIQALRGITKQTTGPVQSRGQSIDPRREP